MFTNDYDYGLDVYNGKSANPSMHRHSFYVVLKLMNEQLIEPHTLYAHIVL